MAGVCDGQASACWSSVCCPCFLAARRRGSPWDGYAVSCRFRSCYGTTSGSALLHAASVALCANSESSPLPWQVTDARKLSNELT
eukprot:scaffold16044_cov67-Phaeocystis_antarctica.AAC.2